MFWNLTIAMAARPVTVLKATGFYTATVIRFMSQYNLFVLVRVL